MTVRCLGFDPGVTTGWAVVEDDGVGAVVVASGEVKAKSGSGIAGIMAGEEAAAQRCWSKVGSTKTIDMVAFEDFVLRPGSTTSREGLAPVRMTMALWMAGDLSNCPVVMVSPSDAKGVMTNERLHELGLWVKGAKHARDAVRVAAVALRRSR